MGSYQTTESLNKPCDLTPSRLLLLAPQTYDEADPASPAFRVVTALCLSCWTLTNITYIYALLPNALIPAIYSIPLTIQAEDRQLHTLLSHHRLIQLTMQLFKRIIPLIVSQPSYIHPLWRLAVVRNYLHIVHFARALSNAHIFHLLSGKCPSAGSGAFWRENDSCSSNPMMYVCQGHPKRAAGLLKSKFR